MKSVRDLAQQLSPLIKYGRFTLRSGL